MTGLGWTTPRWWGRRSVRIRLVLLSIVPLAVALGVGTVALVVLFSAGRVRSVDSQVRAETTTLAALVETGQLTTPLPEQAGSPLFAQVVSADQTVIAASSAASRVLPIVDASRTDGRTRQFTDEDNPFAAAPLRIRVQPATLAGRPVFIVVAAPLSDVRAAVTSLELVAVFVLPGLIALAAVLAWIVIGLTLRPVERMRRAAADIATDITNSTTEVDRPRAGSTLLPTGAGHDEITRLGQTFNDLLQLMQAQVARQRDFVVDAAHELRSPLASLRTQLDVARAHPGLISSDQQVAELSVDVERLIRLTEDLLLLGRLDGAIRGRRERLDLAELAEAGGPPVMVRGDADALQRLLGNLTQNAAAYAATHTVSVTDDGTHAVLVVDDDGPGIPVGERTRVFERWTRLDTARDRRAGGAGLGLALVRDITAVHDGDVHIEQSPLGGTRVTVRLPLDPAPGR